MNVTPESVKELLDSDDFGQRLSAVNQMRYLAPAIAYDLVKKAVADPNPRVRYSAVSHLANVGHQDRETSLKILRDRLRTDSEADVRAAAADSIGALHLTEAYDDLQHLYHNTNEWLVQFSIIAALGELGDVRGFDLLQEALHSDIELVKTAAIGSLGELGDQRAVSVLLDYVDDDDWQVRYRLVQALGKFESDAVQSALTKLANDPLPQVAQEAKAHLKPA
ncbi:MAG: phycobilisome degradation protein NblB [Elainellaceae cyanobacterium]